MNPNILSHIICDNDALENKEILTLSKVNKKYKRSFQVRELSIYSPIEDHRIRQFPYLRSILICCAEMSDAAFDGIILENLTTLNLLCCRGNITDKSFSSFPNLTELSIHQDNITDEAFFDESGNFRFRKLNKLTLHENTKITNRIFQHLSSLTHLEIYDRVSIDFDIMRQLPNLESFRIFKRNINVDEWLNKLPNLQKLKEFNAWDNIIHDHRILQRMTGLTNLNLASQSRVSAEVLGGLTNLTTLFLGNDSIAEDEAFTNKCLTNLTHLDISNVVHPINNRMFLNGTLPKLKTLVMYANLGLTNSIFANKNLSSLTGLDLGAAIDIRGTILSELPNLTSLNISHNEKITDKDFFDKDGNFLLPNLRDLVSHSLISKDIFPDYVNVDHGFY